MIYVIDKSGVFWHEIISWTKDLKPLIRDGEGNLVVPDNHEIYKKGYKIIKV
jgi:hypothetical protein